ncbi:DNA polymerase III [Alicyclobacillaceae bacterium I2511]|nr:DNA polymerase III [Alicyclobacillaceae bacterium I2511]
MRPLIVVVPQWDGLPSQRLVSLIALRWQPGQTAECCHIQVANVDSSFPERISLHPWPTLLSFANEGMWSLWEVGESLAPIQNACEDAGYALNTPVGQVLDLSQLARLLQPGIAAEQLVPTWQTTESDANTDEELGHIQDLTTTTTQWLENLWTRSTAFPFITLQQLTRLASLLSPALAEWFAAAAQQRMEHAGDHLPPECDCISQLVFSSTKPHSTSENALGNQQSSDNVENKAEFLLSANGPLATALSGFEVRPGQQIMMREVVKALVGDTHLLVEAGTGIGKSLAYLIPALLYAKAEDTRVVVSTQTISLQDQIQQRDFPMLGQVVGDGLSLAVLKGRTHYVCLRKIHQEMPLISVGLPVEEIEAFIKLLVWLVETPAGLREELPQTRQDRETWQRVQSESETCISRRCPFFRACYYFRARAAAYDADVLVTNHSLLFTDLKTNHRILPKYDKLIVDEAHHLTEQATVHLGQEVYWYQLLASFNRLTRDHGRRGVLADLQQRLTETAAVSLLNTLTKVQEHLEGLRFTVEQAFVALASLLPQAGPQEVRLATHMVSHPAWGRYLEQCILISDVTRSLGQDAVKLGEAANAAVDVELAGRLLDGFGYLQELLSQLNILVDTRLEDENWVLWLNQSGVSPVTLGIHHTPMNVAKLLHDTLFQETRSVILTSATLSVDGKFDYPARELGLDTELTEGGLRTLSVASPFDYSKQALLCIPNDVPDLAGVTDTQAAAWLAHSLLTLATASGGHMLVLFTSHGLLRATAQSLRIPLEHTGIRLYAQGIDGGRSHLLQSFRNHPQSVLLGAQSFWEGIDLPGKELTVLVIVRLPFAPPTHPVTQARHERLQSLGKSPFWFASLPEAVVRFRQGFGRLIRTTQDRGVVIVYDKRIIKSTYGKSFLRSLSGVTPLVGPEQQVVGKAVAFLRHEH